MTPEEALQHEWIKEGLVHRRPRESNRDKPKPCHRPSPAQSEQSGPPDPYKVPAQPPVKGKTINYTGWTVHARFLEISQI
jgi:hypothetical protein